MASRTIYEISKPTQQFYSVERGGFVNMNEAMYSVVTDMVQLGSFTVANVVYTNAYGLPASTTTWPARERLYTISSGGVGYKANDVLTLVGGTQATSTDPKFRLTVSSVNSTTGAITGFNLLSEGVYTSIPGPAANLSLAYASETAKIGDFDTLANIAGNNGSEFVATPVPGTIDTLTTTAYNTWVLNYGSDGGGGALGTVWPTTGIWYNTVESDLKVGSEVFIVPSDLSEESNSNIIPGTTVVSITSFTYHNGYVFDNTATRWVRTTATGYSVVLSNPVTLSKGDKISYRGTSAQLDNTATGIPSSWRALLDTTAAVDPLSDTVGVFANVAVASTNSTLVQVNDLTTPNNFNPVIYPGQRVTSTLENGSINGLVSVASVIKTGPTTANVILSSAQTLSNVGEQLRFAFPGSPQNWRIVFDVRPNSTLPSAPSQSVVVYAGTDIQLKDNGNLTAIYNSAGTAIEDYAGVMGAKPVGATTPTTWSPVATDPTQGFYNREKRVQNSPEAYPLNYLLTLTNRGMFLGMWEGNWSTLQKTMASTDNFFNWFVIQRPVNRLTGQVLTTGRCPVFCVNSVGYKYWKFIVREEDVLHPTAGGPDVTSSYYNESTRTISTLTTPYRVPADAHSKDNFAIINSSQQVSLTEDSKYLISLIHDLNTPRFRYSEELDMIGQTSADVCMAGQDLLMTTYGESGPRMYHAMPANNAFNSGLRIVALKDIP